VRAFATVNARKAVPRAMPFFDLRSRPTHLDQALGVGVRELKYLSHPMAGQVDTVDALGESLSEPYAHRAIGEQTTCLGFAPRSLVLLAATCTVLSPHNDRHAARVAVCAARDGRHVGICLTEERSR
jgi:hypothetical protein